MLNLAGSALVVDPVEPQTLYAGTGEGFGSSSFRRGLGIFKSVDAGASWTQLPATDNPGFHWVNKVVISTIQRLYSILKGEESFADELDEGSAFTGRGSALGCGSHLYLDATGLVVSGGDHGSVLAPDRRMVDGSVELQTPGDGGALDGPGSARSSGESDSSLRPRRPVPQR